MTIPTNTKNNLRITMSCYINSISHRSVCCGFPDMYPGITIINKDPDNQRGANYTAIEISGPLVNCYTSRYNPINIKPHTTVIDPDFDAHRKACENYHTGDTVTLDLVFTDDMSCAFIENVRWDYRHHASLHDFSKAILSVPMAVWTDDTNTLRFSPACDYTHSAMRPVRDFANKLNNAKYKMSSKLDGIKLVQLNMGLKPATSRRPAHRAAFSNEYAIIDEALPLTLAVDIGHTSVNFGKAGAMYTIPADKLHQSIDLMHDNLADCPADKIPTKAKHMPH